MSSSTSEELSFVQVLRNFVDISGKLNWNSVFQGIDRKERSPVPNRPEEVEEIREFLLDTLLTSGCNEEVDVIRFFEFYDRYLARVWINFYFPGIAGFWDGRETFWRRRSHLDGMDTRYILLPMTDCFFSGIGYVQSTRHTREAEWKAMNIGDWKYLSALVKYGHWKGFMDVGYMQKNDFVELLAYVQERTGLSYLGRQSDEFWNSLRHHTSRRRGRKRRGFRRISLVVRTLKAVVLYSENNPVAEQYVRCLGVYFAANPDPMVSADEVYEFLMYLILRSKFERHFVDRMVRKWVELFGALSYRPRSLAHMCRLTVRTALLDYKSDKNCVLPDLVGLLPIPRALEDFLLGAPEKKLFAKTVLNEK